MDRRNRYSPGYGRTAPGGVNKVKSAIEKFQNPQDDPKPSPSSSQTRVRVGRSTQETHDAPEPRSRATASHMTRTRDVKHTYENVEPQVQEKQEVYEQDGKKHYSVTKTITIGGPSPQSNGSVSSNPDVNYERLNVQEQSARPQSHSSQGSSHDYQPLLLSRPLSQESSHSEVFEEPRRRTSYDVIAEPVECQPVFSAQKGSQNYPTVEKKQPITIKPNERRALASSLFLSAHRTAKGGSGDHAPAPTSQTLPQPRKISSGEFDKRGNRNPRPYGQEPLHSDVHDGTSYSITSPSFSSVSSHNTFESHAYPNETTSQHQSNSRVIMLGDNQQPPVVSSRQLGDGSHQAEITFVAKLPSGQIVQDNLYEQQSQSNQYGGDSNDYSINQSIAFDANQVQVPSVQIMSPSVQHTPLNRKLSQTENVEPTATQSPARHQINLQHTSRKESRHSSSEPAVKTVRAEFSVEPNTAASAPGSVVHSNVIEEEPKPALIQPAAVKTSQVKTSITTKSNTTTESPKQNKTGAGRIGSPVSSLNQESKTKTKTFEPLKETQKKEEAKPHLKSNRDSNRSSPGQSKGAKPTYLVDARQSLKSTKGGAKKHDPVLDLPKIKSRPHAKDSTLAESRTTLGTRSPARSRLDDKPKSRIDDKSKGNDSTPSWVKTAQQRKEEAEAKRKEKMQNILSRDIDRKPARTTVKKTEESMRISLKKSTEENNNRVGANKVEPTVDTYEPTPKQEVEYEEPPKQEDEFDQTNINREDSGLSPSTFEEQGEEADTPDISHDTSLDESPMLEKEDTIAAVDIQDKVDDIKDNIADTRDILKETRQSPSFDEEIAIPNIKIKRVSRQESDKKPSYSVKEETTEISYRENIEQRKPPTEKPPAVPVNTADDNNDRKSLRSKMSALSSMYDAEDTITTPKQTVTKTSENIKPVSENVDTPSTQPSSKVSAPTLKSFMSYEEEDDGTVPFFSSRGGARGLSALRKKSSSYSLYDDEPITPTKPSSFVSSNDVYDSPPKRQEPIIENDIPTESSHTERITNVSIDTVKDSGIESLADDSKATDGTETSETGDSESKDTDGETEPAMNRREAEEKKRKYLRETKPSFVIKPRRCFTDEGKVGKFKASVDGVPKPDVQWEKDGTKIEHGGRYRLYEKTDFHFLEIDDVTVEDKGMYTCVLTNKLGSTKLSAELDVFASRKQLKSKTDTKAEKKDTKKETEVKKTPSKKEETKKTESKLTNGSASKSPEPTKEDTPRNEASRNSIGSKSRKSSTSSESSRASSTLSSRREERRRMRGEPKVIQEKKEEKKPPVLVKGLEDTNAVDGEDVTLECEVHSSSRTEVTWFFNGAQLKDLPEMRQFYDNKTAKLVFKEVFPDDTGKYEIVVSNKDGEIKSSCQLVVTVPKPPDIPPEFTKHLDDMEVEDGQPAIFECHLEASPEPIVSWLKDNKEISPSPDFQMSYDGTVARLELLEVFPEDSGTFCCLAENEAGEARSTATLSVTVLEAPPSEPESEDTKVPVFVQGLADMSVVDGDRVEFVVQVQGSQPMELCWVHEKDEIKIDNKVYYHEVDGDTHKLIIPEVFPEDAGLYICEVYNDFGDTDTSCQLTVEVPPAQGGDGGQGAPYDEVSADDEKEGTIDDHHSVDDQALEAGDYFAPEFLTKPKSITTDEGMVARFVCEVDAEPPPVVRWMKDGAYIEHGGRFQMTSENTIYTLEIPHTLATDTGRYTCVAQNEMGTEKCSASLVSKAIENPDVADFRSLLKARPQLSNKIGASSSSESEREPEQKDFRQVLRRESGAAAKSLERNTLKDADQLDFRGVLKRGESTDQDRKSQHEAEQLDFRNVLQHKRGSQHLENKAAQEADQQDFRNVLTRHVKTKERPKVVEDLCDTKVMEGEPVTLQCKITAIPPPKIFWYLDNKEIKGSKYFQMSYEDEYATLYIAETYAEDQGQYSCRAANESGRSETHCDLLVLDSEEAARDRRPSAAAHVSDVEEPPFIESLEPENLHVLQGCQFQLKGKFVGAPPPEIIWYKAKTEIENGGRFKIDIVRDMTTLTVDKATVEDSGKYVLELHNELGTDNINASVTVEDKPDCPVGKPVASSISGHSLTIAWSGPSYDGGSQVTDYRVEMKKPNELDWKILTSVCKHTSYQVKGLEPNSEYHFRISAGNKHGFSPSGKVSDTIVTIDKRPSMKDCDELPFEPRMVEIDPKRSFNDDYELGEVIGKGKFGSVHLCTSKESGRILAAKFIKARPSQREEAMQEITIMNSLHHPKLLLLWDAYSSTREIILVMEHISGGELLERIINDDYILTERECVHFMRQICDGVLYMHGCNILHLDLKPENILCITPNSNEVKIIDFGLARRYDPTKSSKVLFGTAEFVAPEVINYEDIEYRTDAWSIGVICYILVSGLSPFLGDNDTETLSNVTLAHWDFEDDAFDEISDDAKQFVEQLLVKKLNKRMTLEECLSHQWLSQDVKYMRAKRLSTDKHKRFMARRKWQKTGNAIRALGRMASMQKAFSSMSRSSSERSLTGSRSRQSSVNSDNSRRSRIDESSEGAKDVNYNDKNYSRLSSAENASFNNNNTNCDSILEKPSFVKTLKDFDVFDGDSAKFDVCVSGFPEPDVTWFKDGHRLQQSSKYVLLHDGVRHSLVIKDCCSEDGTEYVCKATNMEGEETCKATLYVEGGEEEE